MMPLLPHCLLGPRHIHPGVHSEADYRRAHAEAIKQGRRKYPNLVWHDPWSATVRPPVFVAGGLVQIRCVTPGCGNCPSVSPDWRVALCWDCGAVYEQLEISAEFAAIERLLVARPEVATRNWLPGETIADLARENAEHSIAAAEGA